MRRTGRPVLLAGLALTLASPLAAQRASIIANTFSPAARPAESGPYTYTLTVKNTGGTGGWFSIVCFNLAAQLPCIAPDVEDFYLAKNQTLVITVGYTALGLGAFQQKHVVYASGGNDSLTTGLVTVIGAPLQTHLAPVAGQTMSPADTIAALFQHASGISTSSLRLLVDGTDYTSSSQISGTTIRRAATGFAGGSHVLRSYGCAVSGRCDTVTTTFVSVGLSGAPSLDDSLPVAQGEPIFQMLPGALPLPPTNLRGCPVAAGDPDIVVMTPGTMIYQPTSPQGYLYQAGLVWDATLTIVAATADNPSNSTRTCAGLPWVEWTGYDWNYWMHSDPDDPLWGTYPYGDRGSLLRELAAVGRRANRRRGWGRARPESSDLDPRHPLFDLTRRWRREGRGPGSPAGTGAGPAGVAGITRGPSGQRGAVPRGRRPVMEPDRPVIQRTEAAGPINPTSYWVTLNGTYIVLNGAPAYSGVALVSLATGGSTFTLPSTSALVNRYNAANPGSSPNGGWNELVASIADSSGNRSSFRTRFVVIDPGAPQDLAITPLRDYRHLDQGECAAFGAFQCGGVTLALTIPGFVSRDRDRSLHLVSARRPSGRRWPFPTRSPWTATTRRRTPSAPG